MPPAIHDITILEIIMIVVAASRIKSRFTSRTTRVTLHVLVNGKHCAAGAAKNRLLIPFVLRPDCDFVIGKRRVAILARVINAATLHLDRDNVEGAAIVLATSLRVEIDSTHLSNGWDHCAGKKRRHSIETTVDLKCNRIKLKRQLIKTSPTPSAS